MSVGGGSMEWRIARQQALYEERRTTVEAALRRIRPGSRIFVGTGCAEPQHLVRSLARFPEQIADTEIVQLISLGTSPVTEASRLDMFRLNTFFVGQAARQAVASGDADYTPIFLSEIPKLVNSRRLHLDVALVQVTPPDPFGNCSLGISVETVKAAVEHATYVIAQVNPRLPRTLGDSFVSLEQLHALVEHEEPILQLFPEPPSEEAERIGFYVSRLVPDGATIQAGIGSIPNAVLHHLLDKRDLGVHTEMFSDGLIDLYEAGVITNRCKNFHPGKTIAAFCLGTQRLYDFVHDNPRFEFHPTDYVSDPRQIARNDTMVAINSALEIDLTGQVCADSLGHQIYSGFGGQPDFIRGAALSRNGRPIIALPSTARGGTVSRIVATLSPGAGVVTTRGDVHYVVTEFGIAHLHGKSLRDRALALINIAHPAFREELLAAAKRLRHVYPDQELSPAGATGYSERLAGTFTTRDGQSLKLRPIRSTDEGKLRRLFYGLDEEDIYYRFMGAVRTLPHSKAQPLVVLDYQEKLAVVCHVGEEPDDVFVGVGRWFVDRASNLAEVAFAGLPEGQGRGGGSFLLARLITAGREQGLAGFTAEVLATNRRMMNLFYASGLAVQSRLEDGVYYVTLRFEEKSSRRGR